MDHCEYTYIGQSATQCIKMDPVKRDASQCVTDCLKLGTSCTGVQIVRAQNPSNTLYAMPNIPFTPYRYNQTAQDLSGGNNVKAGLLDPCMIQDVQARTERGCTAPSLTSCSLTGTKALTLGPNDFVCFGLRPLRNQDNQVEEDYRIAFEPQDPAFYSTCLAVVPPGGFLNIPPVVYTPPSWDQGDSCVKCSFQQSLLSVNMTQSPDWTGAIETPGQCQNCDIKNSALSMAALPLAGSNQPNAGAPPAVTYSWSSGAPGACSCTGVAPVPVTCKQNDGTTVTDDKCPVSSKPPTTASCTAPSSCYEWKVGNWTACSVNCGTGQSTASVACVQSATGPQPGSPVASSMCTGAAPASQRTCTPGACPTAWVQSGWGTCTVSCGTGLQSQTVRCEQTQNGAQSSVGDQYCTTPKPATQQPCNTAACADGQWTYGPWSVCSKECGPDGTQTRTQTCVDKSGAVIAESRCTGTPLPTTQKCNTQSQSHTLAHKF